MNLSPPEIDRLASYLDPFLTLAGDQRTARLTARLVAGTVRGITGSESLVCSRIAAFPPSAGCWPAR
ncbi:MAG: hypothetical protein H0U40_13895 [Chloroflexia bacterium]|nr:hypothetical protein [Chloroflexia bacterium]